MYASPNTRYERFINALVRRSPLPRVDAVREANDKWKTMKGDEAAVNAILVSEEARKRSLESKKLNFGFSRGDARSGSSSATCGSASEGARKAGLGTVHEDKSSRSAAAPFRNGCPIYSSTSSAKLRCRFDDAAVCDFLRRIDVDPEKLLTPDVMELELFMKALAQLAHACNEPHYLQQMYKSLLLRSQYRGSKLAADAEFESCLFRIILKT